jgi:hypothetical protein
VSRTPIWIPKTEAELREAVEQAVLDEGDGCDFKRLLGTGDKANGDLAVDLASMAVNGGLIVVGVEEGPPRSLAPVALKHLAERVDQVARDRVAPPLRVETFPIEAGGRPGDGYLVIAVPASPDAPHSVERVYRGRGDRVNVQLADADVRRIWEERRAARVAADSLLPDVDYDGSKSGRALLRVAFKPEYAERDCLLRALRPDAPATLQRMLSGLPALNQGWVPDLGSHMRFEPRAGGWGFRDGRLGSPSPEDYGLDLLVREDGSLVLSCDRAGITAANPAVAIVLLDIVGGLTWRAADLARAVAARTGYLGGWLACVRLRPILGFHGYTETRQRDPIFPFAYDEDEYACSATLTFAEVDRDPDAIVGRLAGGLGRALTARDFQFATRM